ncbi:MAG: COG1361 S-layer family protein [Brooklawnia sp.]|jgi:hypothetical protein
MTARRILTILAVTAALLLGSAPNAGADTPPAEPSGQAGAPLVELGQGEIPAGAIGKPVKVVVPLVNRGDAPAEQVLITPRPSVDPATFPFEITQTDYTVDAGTLAPGKTTDVELGTFTVRDGLMTGYYALPMSIQYGDGSVRQVVEKTIFVHVQGLTEPKPDTPGPVTTLPPQTVEVVVSQQPGGGGYIPSGDLGDYGSGGGGGEAAVSGSVPRVMLTSFSTNPNEVLAGQAFKLRFGLSNMSSRTGVTNIKVSVLAADASFLPVGGSSSVFIDWIGSQATATGELEFRALPTLEERPYQLSLLIEYEDASNYAPLTAEESIAVVVRQKARAETSTVEALPAAISVGQDANLTFTIQNKGKVRLYNTVVKVKPDQAVSADELFIGNIEPGQAGAVDMMVHAEQTTTDPIILEIIYEDSAGVATTLERKVSIEIEPATEGPDEGVIEPEPAAGGGVLLPVLIGGLVVIGGLAGGYVLNNRRKQRREAELAASMASLDDEPIVPVDLR